MHKETYKTTYKIGGFRVSIQKQNITDQVVLFLKEQIENGIWLPGEKIDSENKLTKELEVSRASVRYAIQQLIAVGILESHQGKGTFVRAIPAKAIAGKLNTLYQENKDMEDILEFRQIIETESCKIAARNITPEILKSMEENLYVMKKDMHKTDEFVKNDLSFHKSISLATGNKMIIRSVELISEGTEQLQRQFNTDYLVKEAIFYHSKILECLKQRDGIVAAEYMRRHLNVMIDEYYRLKGK